MVTGSRICVTSFRYSVLNMSDRSKDSLRSAYAVATKLERKYRY
jgi:hypothetical protein